MLKRDAPAFASGLALDCLAKHSVDFWMPSEGLPDSENRVVLNKDGKICLHDTEHNLEGHRRLERKLKNMLGGIGCEDYLFSQSIYLGKKIPMAGTAHQWGTIRFGNDPKTSALDVNCQAHELENLDVVDSSFFVSSTAVHPGLTIMASALRVGDHLKER